MGDKIGKLPAVETAQETLTEILWIASDKRGHVLTEEHMAWLTLKLKAIRILARRGMRLSSAARAEKPQERGGEGA